MWNACIDALLRHRLKSTAAQRAESAELRLNVIFHVVGQPFDDLSITLTLPEAGQDFPVLLVERQIAIGRRSVGLNGVTADLHQVKCNSVMADRTVHVHNCAPVFRHELHGSVQTRLRRVRIGVLPDDLVSAFGNDLRRKRGNVSKMVIKRVAVDAAVLYDCLDRDLIERSIIEQF